MNWDDANAWTGSLTIDGISGWRLPSMDVNGDSTIVTCEFSSESDCLDNEYGYLYYYDGITASTPDPFTNIQSGIFLNGDSELYWSGSLGAAPDSAGSYDFNPGDPYESANTPDTWNFYAMAVYDGDVSAVPIPAAAWLFGSGLIGLIGIAKCKKTIDDFHAMPDFGRAPWFAGCN